MIQRTVLNSTLAALFKFTVVIFRSTALIPFEYACVCGRDISCYAFMCGILHAGNTSLSKYLTGEPRRQFLKIVQRPPPFFFLVSFNKTVQPAACRTSPRELIQPRWLGNLKVPQVHDTACRDGNGEKAPVQNQMPAG